MIQFPQKSHYDIADFRYMMEVLRGPGGCPWDAAQTHESIRKDLLEEAYELAWAIDHHDQDNMIEELGDVLMQVLFHARIEEEQGHFDIDDVADAAVRKLLFRHPHVFGEMQAQNAEEALDSWNAAKRVEKGQDTVSSAMTGVAESLPALWRAEKIQKKAAKVGFDWPEVQGARDKLSEEIQELDDAIAEGDRDHMMEELGDVLFCVVNIARFCKVDPEMALHNSCQKFISRFRAMEQAISDAQLDMQQMSLEEMDAVYERVKQKAPSTPA